MIIERVPAQNLVSTSFLEDLTKLGDNISMKISIYRKQYLHYLCCMYATFWLHTHTYFIDYKHYDNLAAVCTKMLDISLYIIHKELLHQENLIIKH